MDGKTNSTTEIVYDRETHDYAMYLGGELVGFARTYEDADKTLAALVQPPYAALLDCAGPDVPLDGPSVEEEGGEGGEPPPDEWARFHPMADAVIHAEVLAAAHALGSGPPVWWELLAAAPTPPAPSPLPSAAGGDAASAAGLWFARQRWAQQRAAALGLTHGRAA